MQYVDIFYGLSKVKRYYNTIVYKQSSNIFTFLSHIKVLFLIFTIKAHVVLYYYNVENKKEVFCAKLI